MLWCDGMRRAWRWFDSASAVGNEIGDDGMEALVKSGLPASLTHLDLSGGLSDRWDAMG